jgi:hypothetical protein
MENRKSMKPEVGFFIQLRKLVNLYPDQSGEKTEITQVMKETRYWSHTKGRPCMGGIGKPKT